MWRAGLSFTGPANGRNSGQHLHGLRAIRVKLTRAGSPILPWARLRRNGLGERWRQRFWSGLRSSPGRRAKQSAETMESALARAYGGNPQLNAQRAIVRQNDESVAQALSGYRPTLSATANAGRQYSTVSEIFPPLPPILPTPGTAVFKGYTDPRSVAITGSQTLFNGEQTANRVRAAESQVSAARETLRVMEESVLLAAATAYMDVSRDAANLEVQQNNIRVMQRTLTDTRNRFAAGQVTPTASPSRKRSWRPARPPCTRRSRRW